MGSNYTNCNVKGAVLEPDINKKFHPHDMVEEGILPANWKLDPKPPIFTNCNIINFEIPGGLELDHCNVIPVCEESMAKLNQ